MDGLALIIGGAFIGSVVGTLWGADHPDPFFGWGFNAFVDGTFGFTLGVLAGALAWLATQAHSRRRRP